jgi:hypothetical protein
MSTNWSRGVVRTLIVGSAVGLFFAVSPVAHAQEVGSPDSSAIMNSGDDAGVLEVAPVDDKGKCKAKGGCIKVKGSVHNKTPTEVYALVEYNSTTCAELNEGTWKEIEKPKEGKLTTSTITGHLSNGQCASTTFTFAELIYTADAKKVPSKDDFKAEWTTPDFPKACPNCQIEVEAKVTIEK